MRLLFYRYFDYLILSIVIAFSFYFLTEEVPFYFEDLAFLPLNTPYGEIIFKIIAPVYNLNSPLGAFDRPVENLIFKLIYDCFGWDSTPYRFVKNTFWLLYCLCLYQFLTASFHQRGIKVLAFFSVILVSLLAPIFQSVLWICDFEIIGSFFMFLCFYVFLENYFRGRYSQTVIVVLAIIALSTKVTVKIIPVVLLLYILVNNRKRLKEYALLLLIIFIYATFPLFSASSGVEKLLHEENYLLFSENLFYSCGYWLITGFLLVLYILRNRTVHKEQRETLLFLLIWSFCSVLFWGVFVSSETRYLTSSLIPLMITITYVFQLVFCSLHGNKRKAFVSFIFLLWLFTLFKNVTFTIQYRGIWGTNAIAAHKVINFLE
ncbi:MAG: glycosyltransferase family 39 protein, partial [Nitrospinae bacterium]|nr:glycosyltransferase family 39 protein [Nitrospinota bacterium]